MTAPTAAAPDARQKAKAAMGSAAGFLGGFAPWIVYWILSGSVAYGTAIGVALGLAVLTNVVTLARHGVKALKVLEVGTMIAFAALGVVGLVAGDAFVGRWIQPLGNAALLAIMVVSVVIGKPFTLQYARESTPEELWDTPGFLAVNTLLTWVWIAAMAVMTGLALIPPIVQGDATMNDGGSTLSIICYWVLPFTAMGLAVLVTVKYPDWFGAEFDDVAPSAGKTQAPLPTTGAGDRARSGDEVLDAGPQQALLDEPVSVTLRGAAPGAEVELTATTVDLQGNVWRSRATFTADAGGAVDTATAAPTGGDYSGVDPGGLVWAMRFATEGATPDLYIPPLGPFGTGIEASVGGATLTRTLVRRTNDADVVVRDVDRDGVKGRLVLPAGDGPFPGVALFGGSEGGVDSQFSNAALLASHGFATLSVAYFGMEGLPDHLLSIPLESLAAGVRLLAGRDDVGRVGALAISRGAEGVLSMAAHLDDVGLAAIVAVSPSNVSWTGMGDDGTVPGTPSWTAGGAPVPHLDMADKVLMDEAMKAAFRDRGRRNPQHPHVMHLTRAYAAALGDEAGVAGAAIPAERIDAPLLLLSGSDDQVWPSGPMADALLARRASAGVSAAAGDHHRHYEGGGHLLRLGLMPTDVNDTGGIALGGTREGIAAAQADATPRILAFLAQHLT